MITENKEKLLQYLEKLPDAYLEEVIEYLRFLQFNNKNKIRDKSLMLLSEQSLSKDGLTTEEDEAWKDL
jgi:hypothetical protein